MKNLDNYLNLANSIKADVDDSKYDQVLGGSVNEPISAGMSDFSTAASKMDFRFVTLHEDGSNFNKSILPVTDINHTNEDDDEGFDKFLQHIGQGGKAATEIPIPPHMLKLAANEYNIDWNQPMSEIVRQIQSQTTDQEIAHRSKFPKPELPKTTFGQKPLDLVIDENKIPANILAAAKEVVKTMEDHNVWETYESDEELPEDYLPNQIDNFVDTVLTDESIRNKVSELLKKDLTASHGDLTQLYEIYGK